MRVVQLKLALGCSGISRAEKIKPVLALGQCAACLGYVQYITFLTNYFISKYSGVSRGREA